MAPRKKYGYFWNLKKICNQFFYTSHNSGFMKFPGTSQFFILVYTPTSENTLRITNYTVAFEYREMTEKIVWELIKYLSVTTCKIMKK